MRKYFITSLFFALTLFSNGQGLFESALIPTKEGAIFAFTDSEKSFTLEIISDNITPLEQRNFVMIDNWIFQAFNIDFENPKNKDFTKEDDQKSALSQYVMYEVDYFKNELGYKCDSLTFEWGDINNKKFYFWYFNTPDTIETLQKQMYLTTICHNQFLNMNIPLEKGVSFIDGKDFLFKIAKTLKVNDTPIDFDKLNDEINKVE